MSLCFSQEEWRSLDPSQTDFYGEYVMQENCGIVVSLSKHGFPPPPQPTGLAQTGNDWKQRICNVLLVLGLPSATRSESCPRTCQMQGPGGPESRACIPVCGSGPGPSGWHGCVCGKLWAQGVLRQSLFWRLVCSTCSPTNSHALHHTATPHWLSVPHMAVCMLPRCSVSPSRPLLPLLPELEQHVCAGW